MHNVELPFSLKMRSVIVFLGLLVFVAAVPRSPQRIVGGSLTTISSYKYGAALLYSWNMVNYQQSCGGTILTNRAVLSAAHCFLGDSTNNWRVRVGSSFANSGGTVHAVNNIIINPKYNSNTHDNDVALLKTASNIVYGNLVQPASIAGSNFILNDNQAVNAIGWGTTASGGSASEQLRHVQVWTVNQLTCKSRYSSQGVNITENMLCSGWLDVGGRDQCQGDSGGPLIHNNVIVGICSFGIGCAQTYYPGVNTRVSRFTTWIQSNA